MKYLPAKLTRPRLTAVVVRRRLFDRLDRAVGKQTVWISAPAGSGKTTLLANWLDTKARPYLWYQADEGDADIASFFSNLRTAAGHAAPRYRTPLPLLTAEYRLGIPTFTKRFFEALFGRLKRPFFLVIDNYQDVPPGSLFHDVVRDGISAAPEGIAILIASRTYPPPAFERLRTSGSITVLEPSEMDFTHEESRSLIKMRWKKRPSEENLNLLYQKTSGWAAGLVLLTETTAEWNHILDLKHIPSDRIFDYFASELFERADREVQTFLLMTAHLPIITARTAEKLTGSMRAEHILSLLSRSNFFTQRHATSEVAYQYHPLFREFLLSRARQQFSLTELRQTRNAASQLLIQDGQDEEAARLLAEIGDWEDLSALVLRHARPFMSAGRFQTIETWIDSIPAEVTERNGWLLFWKAQCRLPSQPAEARRFLEKAYALLRSAEDASGAFLSWSGIVHTFLFEWRDFQPLDRWIDEFAGLQQRYDGFPSVRIEEEAISAMFAALLFRQPHHAELPRLTEHARDIMLSTTDVSLRMFIGYHLILHSLWTGRINEAGALVTMLSPVIRSDQGPPISRLMWLRSEALYYFYTCQYEAGLRTVDRGLRLSAETGVRLFDVMLYSVGIYNCITSGLTGQAREFLVNMAASLNRGACFEAIFFSHQSSLVELIMGRYDAAITEAERCMRLSRSAGAPLLINGHQYTLVNILFEAELYDRVKENIAEMKERNSGYRMAHVDAWCSVMEAMLALTAGDDVSFSFHARRAIALCKRTGFRYLLIRRETLTAFCTKALALGIERPFIRELISMNRLETDHLAETGAEWPWPVKIQTLGRFELLIDDRPVRPSGKVQQKPLSLLKALVAFGGYALPAEQLTDALWPDAEGDMGHASFDTTLHRLRKLIGNEKAFIVRDGMVSLDARYCWTDIRAFEQLLCKAQEAWDMSSSGDVDGHETDKAEEAIRLTDKAVTLYKGHFLPADARQPWTISVRERLRAKYIYSIERLGRHWGETGRYDMAVHCFQKGLEVDDLAEEFYQHLMVCYHQLGQQTEATKTYRRCRSVLRNSLGVSPSMKTENIHFAIRQKA